MQFSLIIVKRIMFGGFLLFQMMNKILTCNYAFKIKEHLLYNNTHSNLNEQIMNNSYVIFIIEE